MGKLKKIFVIVGLIGTIGVGAALPTLAATETRYNVKEQQVEGDGKNTQWVYGTRLVLSGTSGFSNYFSSSRNHSSEVKIGGITATSSTAGPGTFSNANRTSNYGATAQYCSYTLY